MSIDYVLQFPCEVRRQIPNEKLVALAGYMSLAEFAVGQIRNQHPELPIETILATYQVNVQQSRPDGTVSQVPQTIGQLVALAQPLRPFREQCKPCRANIADRPFGCIAKINYPIREESEQWLLGRLPADGNDAEMATLFRFVADLGIDGAVVDVLRPKFFAQQAPLVRRWGTLAGPKQLSSSQLLQMLAYGGGRIVPQQAALYTRLLRLATVLKDPHPPSDQIEQWKTFLCAVVMAGRLDAEIVIDA
jgi:hypothetical protein